MNPAFSFQNEILHDEFLRIFTVIILKFIFIFKLFEMNIFNQKEYEGHL